MECNLKSPFKEAFENGDSIDYKLVPGAKKNDHTIVKEMGYETKMHSDCSYSAKGLPGLSLSSYGDWDGVVYPMIKEEFGDDDDITLYIVKYNG